MTDHAHDAQAAPHSHGGTFHLDDVSRAILAHGLTQLIDLTEGLSFGTLPSQRCPLPLTLAAYRTPPTVGQVREDVRARMETDPVSVLESALSLLELYESNQPDTADLVMEDGEFTDACFASKRLNGWIAFLGDADRDKLEEAIAARWRFRFYSGPPRPTGIYLLLGMLARYGFIYGKIPPGDFHAMGHFVEDFAPGLIVLSGRLSDLELTLSLAAMKMGVPAVVPADYPFPLGRSLRVAAIDDLVEAVVGFPNIRRLLVTPDAPQMPPYCSNDYAAEKFEPAAVWGDTPESFLLLRKGKVETPGAVTVTGKPQGPMGVILTVDAEPMDAIDRRYIERSIANSLSMMTGVRASYDGDRLILRLREGTTLAPARIGEVLLGALGSRFSKIKRASAEVIFDQKTLAGLADCVKAEKERRQAEIAATTEETTDEFYTCIGCSSFAPDHVCILTPERTPQCGRPFEQIKTGALYACDDISGIHHSKLHRHMNSFGVVKKGELIDASTGQWRGVNDRVAEITGGRTMRVMLHSLDDNPHTGCGCFRIVMFKTEKPREGIAVMDAAYQGRCPDGRSWRDLHYLLAGKQSPGIAGASPAYLRSPRFLAAHGGWDSIVWVSPKVAQIMADDLPPHVQVG